MQALEYRGVTLAWHVRAGRKETLRRQQTPRPVSWKRLR
jgi:hypothetical protein